MTASELLPAPRADQVARSLTDVLKHADETVRNGGEYAPRQWATGFTPLDTFLGGGLRAGELTLLGGPQGLGKTTFALQIARNVAAAGGHALYVCYEHGERELLERVIGMESGLTSGHEGLGLTDIRKALRSHVPSLDGVAGRLGEAGHGRATVAALASYSDRLHFARASGTRTGLAELAGLIETMPETGVVVVDYLQKVAVPGDIPNEDERVTRIVEGLKDLSLDTGTPVVAIVAADKTGIGTGRTRLHDLRGSTALAYEADVALLLNDKFGIVARHHLVYDTGNAERFHQYVVCSIEKNRGGLDGIDLEFEKRFDQGRFEPNGGPVQQQLIDDRVFVE